MSGEKAGFSRAAEYDINPHHAEHAQHSHLHRTATAPSLGHSAQEYARSLQAAAYGGSPASTAYRHPSPAAEAYHHRDRYAPYDHHPAPQYPNRSLEPAYHSGGHPQHTRMMAPPIRLQSDDLIPEQYERFAHVPGEAHHRHHHTEVNEVRRGEYLRELAYGNPRRGRDVYA